MLGYATATDFIWTSAARALFTEEDLAAARAYATMP